MGYMLWGALISCRLYRQMFGNWLCQRNQAGSHEAISHSNWNMVVLLGQWYTWILNFWALISTSSLSIAFIFDSDLLIIESWPSLMDAVCWGTVSTSWDPCLLNKLELEASPRCPANPYVTPGLTVLHSEYYSLIHSHALYMGVHVY